MTTHLPRVRSAVLGLLLTALLTASLSLASPGADASIADPQRAKPADRALSIHTIGDSITFGNSHAGYNTPGGYRTTLARVLAKDGVTPLLVGTSVDNPPPGADPRLVGHDGWNGQRIEQLTASLAGPTDLGGGNWLVRTPTRGPIDADVTVVMAGVNDIYQRFDPQHPGAAANASYDPRALTTFVDDAADRLHQLVQSVHRLDPKTTIVLCTNVPIQNLISDRGPAIDSAANTALNRTIRGRLLDRLRRQGVPVVLADVEKDFRAKGGAALMDDGIHPTSSGYAVLGRSVARAVLASADEPGLTRRTSKR